MVRRSIALVVSLLFLASTACVVAATAPVFVQPQQSGLSGAALSALESAVAQLVGTLRVQSYASGKSFGSGGWTPQQFAAYTAGTLERLGYVTAIVAGQAVSGEALRVWVGVRIDLEVGLSVWVPVEPIAGDVDKPQTALGVVPLREGSALSYDEAYLVYDRAVDLPPNLPPTARINIPNRLVENRLIGWSAGQSTDPDGEIVYYEWTFDGRTRGGTSPIGVHRFSAGGATYTVTLTVTDSRGAQHTANVQAYVMTEAEAEREACGGCG